MTPSEVREKFSYTPTTGVVIHRHKVGKVCALQPAGTVACNGYLQTRAHGRTHLNHRLAWCIHYGEWPDGIIDHIDRNPMNNRIDNLRVATRKLNKINSGLNSNSTSGVKGVTAMGKKWQAHIRDNGKRITIGTFATIEEAAAARAAAEQTIWKE